MSVGRRNEECISFYTKIPENSPMTWIQNSRPMLSLFVREKQAAKMVVLSKKARVKLFCGLFFYCLHWHRKINYLHISK